MFPFTDFFHQMKEMTMTMMTMTMMMPLSDRLIFNPVGPDRLMACWEFYATAKNTQNYFDLFHRQLPKSPKSLILYIWSFVNVFISYIDHLSMFNWQTSLTNMTRDRKTETSKKSHKGPSWVYFRLHPLPVYLRMPLYLWRPPSLSPPPPPLSTNMFRS